MHRSKKLAGSLKNTCSMSSLGREFMMHFSCIARLLVLLLGAILTTIQLVFVKKKGSFNAQILSQSTKTTPAKCMQRFGQMCAAWKIELDNNTLYHSYRHFHCLFKRK